MSLHIYGRYCNFSNISATKERPKWFSRESCFESLYREYKTWPFQTTFTALFDGDIGKDHFLNKKNVKIEKLNSGSGAKSFIDAVDFILKQPHKDDDIIYLVEDDYLHIAGWRTILLDAFNLKLEKPVYATLYDHPDKYMYSMYKGLTCELLKGNHSHWRTTPSTTDTFACKFSTLKAHRDQYLAFAQNSYSLDHQRSLHLWTKGACFISCMPGYSTHISEYMSPFVNWESINQQYEIN